MLEINVSFANRGTSNKSFNNETINVTMFQTTHYNPKGFSTKQVGISTILINATTKTTRYIYIQ